MTGQKLSSSENARAQDGAKFSKFKMGNLTPAPEFKDDSYYLPTSHGDLLDLHTDIPSSTKTMCFAMIYRASRNVGEP